MASPPRTSERWIATTFLNKGQFTRSHAPHAVRGLAARSRADRDASVSCAMTTSHRLLGSGLTNSEADAGATKTPKTIVRKREMISESDAVAGKKVDFAHTGFPIWSFLLWRQTLLPRTDWARAFHIASATQCQPSSSEALSLCLADVMRVVVVRGNEPRAGHIKP